MKLDLYNLGLNNDNRKRIEYLEGRYKGYYDKYMRLLDMTDEIQNFLIYALVNGADNELIKGIADIMSKYLGRL